MTGSLAPPPPYGSEQGSVLLESGRDGVSQGSYSHSHSHFVDSRHGRTRSGNFRLPTSPGPVRSPTDISLAHLVHIPSNEDAGEGTSSSAGGPSHGSAIGLGLEHHNQPPPEYTSPPSSDSGSRRGSYESRGERAPLVRPRVIPPIPSYSDAMAGDMGGRGRASSAAGRS
jgi:hypothetical protein